MAPEVPSRVPTAADSPPKVELIDAGREPRRELRLTFTKGATFERVMSMQMGAELVVNGELLPRAPVPTISMPVRGTIESVDEHGDARYSAEMSEATIEGMDLPPAAMAMIKVSLADIAGTRIAGRVSPRGLQSDGKITTKSMNPQFLATMDSLKQSFGQMSVPLPVEAIGVGGKWSVTSDITINGMPLRQRAVYTVVSVSERGVMLRLSAEQSLQSPDAKMENLPAGTEGVARSLSGTYSGMSIMSLEQFMPQRATISGVSKADMEVTTLGQKTPVLATYDMKVRLRTPSGPGNAAEAELAEEQEVEEQQAEVDAKKPDGGK